MTILESSLHVYQFYTILVNLKHELKEIQGNHYYPSFKSLSYLEVSTG